MNLEPYGNAVGISDILQYRTCPERFVWGMRRHLELPERLALRHGERDEPPESTNWTTAYGSAIHEAINQVELGKTHDEATADALKVYGNYLTPQDIELLADDLRLYEFRHPKGVELVSAERDMRVPLFKQDGVQYYFRFKLDVLFRSLSAPDVFLHRDYKSSAHRKSKAEVHSDVQLWSYNWAIHEMWPEIRLLRQEYDQLKFGVEYTWKNAEQRRQIKQWLIAQVKTILADDTFAPKINDFCRWCPMITTCRETKRATNYWRGRLAITAPLKQTSGRSVKVEFLEEADELERIIREDLPKMQAARKHLEAVEKELKKVLMDMTEEERARLGWRLTERRTRSITPEGVREVHELLGDEVFYGLVSLSSTKLEEFTGKPKKGQPVPPVIRAAREATIEDVSSITLVQTSK